jgi:hypothetical protein
MCLFIGRYRYHVDSCEAKLQALTRRIDLPLTIAAVRLCILKARALRVLVGQWMRAKHAESVDLLSFY